MTSRICCQDNHSVKGISIREAAIALAEGRAIGVCKKCGKDLQYITDHISTSDPAKKQHTYVVTRVVRLTTRLAGDHDCDPFLLLMRDADTGEQRILATSWAYDQSSSRHGAQFPPLLSLAEWKALFRRLDASLSELEERIRLRAYEIYEGRGRQDGHALDDWLAAEAELTARGTLRAAA